MDVRVLVLVLCGVVAVGCDDYRRSPGVAVEDGVAYVENVSHNIEALALGTGEVLWSLDVSLEATGPLAVFEDTVYLATGRAVIALRPGVCEELWRVQNPSPLARVVATQDRVFTLTQPEDGESMLSALRRSDGGLVWTRPVHGAPLHASFVASEEGILIGQDGDDFDHFKVRAFDANTGSHLWRFEMGSEQEVAGLQLVGQRAFVLVNNYAGANFLRAFELESGEVLWESDDVTSFHASQEVIVTAKSPEIIARDAESFEARWRLRLSGEGSFDVLTSAEGVVLAHHRFGYDKEKELIAFDLHGGALRWRTPHDPAHTKFDARIEAGLAAAYNTMGAMEVFELETGDRLWQRRPVQGYLSGRPERLSIEGCSGLSER